MTPNSINRRDFVRAAALTTGSLAMSQWMTACLEDGPAMLAGPSLGTVTTTRYPLRIPPVAARMLSGNRERARRLVERWIGPAERFAGV